MMSSLYIGATGMKAQSSGLNVIANNLANVNSVAYKQQSILFEDILGTCVSSASGTATGISQSGSGAAVSDIRTLFMQGALESTTSTTDLAISGTGWFGVQQGGVTRYTRSGNFSLTANGSLVDANGWNVLGRAISSNGMKSSELTAISIDLNSSGNMAAQATSQITACANLGGLEDCSQNARSSLFALGQAWDGTSSTPLDSSQYSYSQDFQYYDSNGTLRTGSIYYDLAGEDGGTKAVEYIITVPPGADASGLSGTRGAGLLAAGTLTFSSSGELVNMTAFTPPSSGDTSDLSAWTAASVQNGFPAVPVTPSGAKAQTIQINMGLSLSSENAGGGAGNAQELADNPPNAYRSNASAVKQKTSSTLYGTSQSAISQSYNGYTTGELTGLTIGSDGTITGKYSNGQTRDLYSIPLFRFTSEDGLIHEGNGQYSASSASGAADEGTAGTENFGTIESNSLEQSNVDYATEFTNLIVTQRGFQMNSKVITTTDTMLQKALELKR